MNTGVAKIAKEKLKILPKSLLLCIAVRVFSVFFVQTSFVPDEYWQSLEVAHKIAFGYGYSTWEWRLGVRSYFHPAFIAFLYKILEFTKCDTVESIVILPRLTQALVNVVCDYLFVKWHKKTTGCNGNWAWFVVISSWFWFYCASRTLSNTLETSLVMAGLYLYPWEHVVLRREPERARSYTPSKCSYLWIVAFSCVLRPTAGVFWFPLVVLHVIFSKAKMDLIFSKFLTVAATVLVVSFEFDKYFHGEAIFTWWNFFTVNILRGVGDFYGSNVFFWYFFAGLPIALGTLVVPFAYGIINIFKTTRILTIEAVLVITGFWTIGVLSLVPHKELRFLLPVLPLCFHVTATWLSDWSRRANAFHRYGAAVIIALGSIIMSIYLGHYHQRGTLDAMSFLAKESRENPTDTNLLFLMPCHSTPLYSHLHINVSTRFLTCEPDLFDDEAYFDEAELFYSHPQGWLNRTFPANRTSQLPSHIILFDPLRQEIESFLHANRYTFLTEFYHSKFPEGRVGKYVVIFKRMVVKTLPQLVFD